MRDQSIFAGLNPEELRSLSMEVEDIACHQGDVLYRMGDSARYAYTLRAGAVKLVKFMKNGQEVIIRLLHRGDLLGFEGMQEAHHRHGAIALAPSQLCRLDLAELQRLSERLPKVREAILQRWQQALQSSEDRIMELGAKRAEARLATFLLQWAEHYPQLRHLPFPLSRPDLAAFLGLSTEHVSRIMADFKRHAFIQEQRGQLEILAPQSLADIAGKLPDHKLD
ncbi:Crp/Fnr family transcriptional regulator [Acidithiobacillus sp. M4-SHS-6]|uniref:Crp/Fnr family transcriptional regulator n=1 Tax=Acidithiobacillus sp. M4-SHS-6 TaxID=3383024 RepID=UPI0039BEC962